MGHVNVRDRLPASRKRGLVCCSALQCVAVRGSALQCVACKCSRSPTCRGSRFQCVAACCSVLQCVAVQCVAEQYMSFFELAYLH